MPDQTPPELPDEPLVKQAKPDWPSFFARPVDPDVANFVLVREPFQDRDVFPAEDEGP